jgi:predicted PolB exonuclease-like 3'-5' exonuclease
MINDLILENILFLDIETVPQFPSYDEMPEKMKELWGKKAEWLIKNEEDTAASIYSRAGIYAEFGKVICISAGFIKDDGFRIKSFYGIDEKEVLAAFSEMLNRHYRAPDKLLCAHNGKEFDFPYLSRRMIVNRIPLPEILRLYGKKPWEVAHLDTMELWKFGDYKNYTSLDLLTAILEIPSPKGDISGSDVGRVFWEENDLERIRNYCQKDALAVAQLLLRYIGKDLIPEEKVKIV